MSYQDFLDSLLYGINLFLDNFDLVINNLFTNYIFITFLGITIFLSLLNWFLKHVVFAPLKVKDNIDYWVDTKRNYKLYNDVKYNYMFTNDIDVNLYKYKNLVMSKQVQALYLSNNTDLESYLKRINLNLGRKEALLSLQINKDLEYKLKEENYKLQQLVKKNNSIDEKIFEDWERKKRNNKSNLSDIKESQDILDNF